LSADSNFAIYSNSNATRFNYIIDPELILNPTYCFIDVSRQYSVLQRETSFEDQNSKKNLELKKAVLFVSSDIIILTLSLLSGPIGNLVIGFLQFNKIFLFLSLSEMEGGQFYQYINVNLYESKKSGKGFYVNPIDEYQFLTQSSLRYGDKIITKFTIFLFLGLLLAGILCLIINKILSFFESTPKIEKASQFLHTNGYKIL
jgi:hypothetical protein